jgi:hypothetical protein
MLPAGKDGGALHIKAFETETSNYSQNVADIWNTTSFDRISLKTSNGYINAKVVLFSCLIEIAHLNIWRSVCHRWEWLDLL